MVSPVSLSKSWHWNGCSLPLPGTCYITLFTWFLLSIVDCMFLVSCAASPRYIHYVVCQDFVFGITIPEFCTGLHTHYNYWAFPLVKAIVHSGHTVGSGTRLSLALLTDWLGHISLHFSFLISKMKIIITTSQCSLED